MRKKMINPTEQQSGSVDPLWLDLEKLAAVEVTSEAGDFPIESAMLPGELPGWRAAIGGVQTIRIIFDHPQQLHRIRVNFAESEVERTQEYLLRCSSNNGESYQEIVRQQWNFSPTGTTHESEDFQVDLAAVTIVELIINPDISNHHAIASLVKLQLA
ncbi:MAG: carbohydrate-binding protein [Gammaproteobacteria bacterium]|nr:carbohydrate-binding protein [Gammaproteobacteria bacterium]